MFDNCNIRTIQLKDGQVFSGCSSDFEEREDHTIIYRSGFFAREHIHVGCIVSDHLEFSLSKLLISLLIVLSLTFILFIALLGIISYWDAVPSQGDGELSPPVSALEIKNENESKKEVDRVCPVFRQYFADSAPILSLKQGAKYVTYIQWLQKQLAISETGQFDQNTHQAVIAFQKQYSLKVDGKVGEKTWRALLRNQICSAVL